MDNLIYSMLTWLDGYMEDEHGRFGWGALDEEMHSYINELASSFGTYLYSRIANDTSRLPLSRIESRANTEAEKRVHADQPTFRCEDQAGAFARPSDDL
jgi:hypothetical protein